MVQILNKCPVCISSEHSPSYVVRGYQYWLCDSCGILYLDQNDAKVQKSSNSIYDSDYFQDSIKEDMSGYMDYGKQERPLRMNFKRYIFRISHYLNFNKTNSMLDVGCAYGFLLDEARKMGISIVQGIDLSKSAIEWMEEHFGIKGTVGTLADIPNGQFDLITASEVIEHIPVPRKFLVNVSDMLRKGGLLVIITGANDVLLPRLLKRLWWYLNPPSHCCIFSRASLRKLVIDSGFDVLDHRLFPFHWVGLNNVMLKIARILKLKWVGQLASKLPTLIIPIPHFSTQFLIAKRQ